MRMSQALRRGAKLGPQVHGGYGDGNGGTCALGALLVGSGCLAVKSANENCPYAAIEWGALVFHELRSYLSPCPACGQNSTVGCVIVCLNDKHYWTRERIAGWLEAHIEVPTYSMLQMQEYMEDPELPAAAKEELAHV